MSILYVMFGVPDSGKTTYSKQLADTEGLTRFARDEMRCRNLTELMTPVVESLRNGDNVVVDSVHSRLVDRQKLLQLVKRVPCKKVLVYMNTSLDECLKRNANKPHPLTDEFIKFSYRSLQRPRKSEGWDEIMVINETD